jgi:hypothetical protein
MSTLGVLRDARKAAATTHMCRIATGQDNSRTGSGPNR